MCHEVFSQNKHEVGGTYYIYIVVNDLIFVCLIHRLIFIHFILFTEIDIRIEPYVVFYIYVHTHTSYILYMIIYVVY